MPFYRRAGNAFRLTENLCRIASVLVVAGDPGNAVRLIACTEVLFEEMGGTQPWVAHENAETLAAARAKLDETAFADAWRAGRRLTADEAAGLALESLEHV